MSPNYSLTAGAIQRIQQGATHTEFQPNLQVLELKKIQNQPGANAVTRYKLTLSDGNHYQSAMLATQLNYLVTEGQIQQYSLIAPAEFMSNEVQGRKILIILKCNVVESAVGHQIGNPVEYGGGASSSANGSYGSNARPAAPGPLQTMHGARVPHQVPIKNESAAYGSSSSSSSSAAGAGGYRGGYSSSTSGGAAASSSSSGPSAAYGGYGAAARGAGAGAVVRDPDSSHGHVIPIAELNPYQNRWTIKARVTNKSDIKRWSNAKGEGTLFSIDLLDEHGGEIRAAFFKDACERFFPLIEQGGVYTFSGGRLKVAQKQWSSIKNNYEITFDDKSDIRPVDDDHKIQAVLYSFKKINTIESIEPNTTIDVIGICKSYGPEQTITTKKDGREVAKRDLTLVDDSGVEVRVTLWGDKASNDPDQWENNPVVAIKGCKVSDYNGRSLGTLPASQVAVNPDLPEAGHVFDWWHQQGSTAVTTSISTGGSGGGGGPVPFEARHFLSSIRDEHLGFAEKPDYIEVKATITYIKNDPDPWYRACTNGDCKRKVTEEMGGYRCEKCQRTMPECAYRYILSISATDISGSQYISCFDEHANQILGKTAEELHEFKVAEMQARFEAVFQEANFTPYIFKLRIKAENVNDEQRVKSSIMNIRPINYVQECRDLVNAIRQFA